MLAPLSNDEIDAAKTHWEAKNDESLVDKLNSEIRGGLKELIVGLLTGKRTESEEADEVGVQSLFVSSRAQTMCAPGIFVLIQQSERIL